MGSTFDRLRKQLKTDLKQEAQDCIKIYNCLKELNDGKVWSDHWRVFVTVTFDKYPSCERMYKPSKIGRVFLKGIIADKNES